MNQDQNDERYDEQPTEITPAAGVSEERAKRFYDRVREKIEGSHGKKNEKFKEYLLLVPDIFMLLVRLSRDSRVTGKNKVLLLSSIVYFFSPLDIIPEALLGPFGYLDDLVFGVYVLNKMLSDTDPEILRQHWSGRDDILETIRRVLNAADTLVTTDVVSQIKKWVK